MYSPHKMESFRPKKEEELLKSPRANYSVGELTQSQIEAGDV